MTLFNLLKGATTGYVTVPLPSSEDWEEAKNFEFVASACIEKERSGDSDNFGRRPNAASRRTKLGQMKTLKTHI